MIIPRKWNESAIVCLRTMRVKKHQYRDCDNHSIILIRASPSHTRNRMPADSKQQQEHEKRWKQRESGVQDSKRIPLIVMRLMQTEGDRKASMAYRLLYAKSVERLTHLSVTISEQLVKDVTEFPTNNWTFLQSSPANNVPKKGGTFLLMCPDQYHCEKHERVAVNQSEIKLSPRGKKVLTSNVLLFHRTLVTAYSFRNAGDLNNEEVTIRGLV